MSKRQFKSQASSGRLGGGFAGFGGGFGNADVASTHSSTLSYIQEPPDYSLISDSSLLVAFKNLSKKDSTTKAKALEDLQNSSLVSDTDVEDGIIEAWVRLFPRLSIDSSRRVRQLAHTFNGQLGANCGKRIAKHLPRLAGAWLAGGFDTDRSAAKASHDSLNKVFPSSEKVAGLKKTFQSAILQYCKDALLDETPQTLSDERIVSADDAATTYARVISCAIAVISNLLQSLSPDDVSKHNDDYALILSDSKFWAFAYHADASIRRTTHRLVRAYILKRPNLVGENVRAASHAYVYKALPSDQTASSQDFVQTLEMLTASYPSIWTDAYAEKRPAVSRLRQCLKHGSHSGSSSYWESVSSLCRRLPLEILPSTYDEAAELLLAAREGVSKKEERFNAFGAWTAYFELVDVTTRPMSGDLADSVLQAFAIPVVNHFIHPSDDTVIWSIAGARPASLVSRVARISRMQALLQRKWPHMAEKLVEVARLSQPEQSTNYEQSQRHVATTGERFSELQREFYSVQETSEDSWTETLTSSSLTLAEECIALLQSRNGKPYGAAAILEEQLRACGTRILAHCQLRHTYFRFAVESVPLLFGSPSQRHLAACLYAAHSDPDFASALIRTIDITLDLKEDIAVRSGIRSLFPPNSPSAATTLAKNHGPLQHFLMTETASSNEIDAMSLFSYLLSLGAVDQATTDSVLSTLTESLSVAEPSVSHKLVALEHLASSNIETMRTFISETGRAGRHLLPAVLLLEQSADDTVADRAVALSSRLTSTISEAGADTKYGIILENLVKVSNKSLPIDAVLDLAQRMAGDAAENSQLVEMLPDTAIWYESLCAVATAPKASLSILSPLGGALHFVQETTDPDRIRALYDAQGLSQAMRLAMYVSRLLGRAQSQSRELPELPTILALLSTTVFLAEDNISVPAANGLWKHEKKGNDEEEVLNFVIETNVVLKQLESMSRYMSQEDAGVQASVSGAVGDLRTKLQNSSPMAYYSALALTRACENEFELNGFTNEQVKSSESKLKAYRAAKEPITLIAHIVGFAQPLAGTQALNRQCNELVADLSSFKLHTSSGLALEALVTLNAIFASQEDVTSSIAKTRIIRLVKHITPWASLECSPGLISEVYKALGYLLPGLSDMYGEHWMQILTLLVDLWRTPSFFADGQAISESGIPILHASLKLWSALKRMLGAEDVNDDLQEAIKDQKDLIHDGMIAVLKSLADAPDENHEPLRITNELIARHISQLPERALGDADELYPLLWSSSRSIQGAAFDLLHKHILETQEQISFDAALDNKAARLPDELLSLLIETPTLDSLAEASFERSMPAPLRSYLLSWRLVFDHFSKSSYRVKVDYIEQLKEDALLNGLLALTFAFLGHERGRPVDVSKFDVQEYIPEAEPSPEKDVQWLLTHLYFLALLHLPNLVQSYARDIRSRQTLQAVESWTAKFISPSITTASLQSVSHWAESSVKEDPDYENMTVKVGMRSREVNVSYLVDEQTMAIKVELPESYPLDSAKVVSVSRVAVKEDKWNSWLRNCQGVITFSNGSITDGLAAWRKNVTGALKGQTECAICYSIISGDKQLPTKRCPTCKNLFHSSCLFKWFKTSNASTCPLCRNPFNFN